MTYIPEEHDFVQLLSLSREELVRELLDTTTLLANLSERLGWLRARETQAPEIKMERVELEGQRGAWDEKKWSIIRLIELYDLLRQP